MQDKLQIILKKRQENGKMRDREFASSIGISEAELVAAFCAANQAQRIIVDFDILLKHLPSLGVVMALTRNETAVHEVIGRFEKIFPGKSISLTLGEIDLRIFQNQWVLGFAREIDIRGKLSKTIQFFDQHGVAVFKLYEQEGSDRKAWELLIQELYHEDQTGHIAVTAPLDIQIKNTDKDMPDIEAFRKKWKAMTDVHQLSNILQEMKISRHDAVKFIGNEFATELSYDSIALMLEKVSQQDIPIMCFVGNHGCIQIFTGHIGAVKMFDTWLNLLDEKFHLHLQMADIDKVWFVKKPSKDGLISSVEVFDKHGNLVIQFFGARKEGNKELSQWRNILEALPIISGQEVA